MKSKRRKEARVVRRGKSVKNKPIASGKPKVTQQARPDTLDVLEAANGRLIELGD